MRSNICEQNSTCAVLINLVLSLNLSLNFSLNLSLKSLALEHFSPAAIYSIGLPRSCNSGSSVEMGCIFYVGTGTFSCRKGGQKITPIFNFRNHF